MFVLFLALILVLFLALILRPRLESSLALDHTAMLYTRDASPEVAGASVAAVVA
jgi:hypothetical protein